MHAKYLFLSFILAGVGSAARKRVLESQDVPTACAATCQFALSQTTTCDDENRRRKDYLECVCAAPNAQVQLQQCSDCIEKGSPTAARVQRRSEVKGRTFMRSLRNRASDDGELDDILGETGNDNNGGSNRSLNRLIKQCDFGDRTTTATSAATTTTASLTTTTPRLTTVVPPVTTTTTPPPPIITTTTAPAAPPPETSTVATSTTTSPPPPVATDPAREDPESTTTTPPVVSPPPAVTTTSTAEATTAPTTAPTTTSTATTTPTSTSSSSSSTSATPLLTTLPPTSTTLIDPAPSDTGSPDTPIAIPGGVGSLPPPDVGEAPAETAPSLGNTTPGGGGFITSATPASPPRTTDISPGSSTGAAGGVPVTTSPVAQVPSNDFPLVFKGAASRDSMIPAWLLVVHIVAAIVLGGGV